MLASGPGMGLPQLALEDEGLTIGLPGESPHFSFPLLYVQTNATLLSLS